jgi:hypothetical protein
VVWRSSELDTIQLQPHVHVYGGFTGSESFRDERDWEWHLTTLDGSGSSDRVFHVVTGSDDATIDGFWIVNGNANESAGGWPNEYGGGMLNDNVSPTVRNCTFHRNRANISGAAMYNRQGTPTIEGCTFYLNTSRGSGGAISNYQSNATIIDCEFNFNAAEYRGGGIHNFQSTITVERCKFLDNTIEDWSAARQEGGGISLEGSNASVISNSIFTYNVARDGAGIYIRGALGPSPTIRNCLVYGNRRGYGIHGSNANFTVANTIIWNNYSGAIYVNVGSATRIRNQTSDPLFSTYFHLSPASPCIDAGDGDIAPATDFDGNPRVDDLTVTDTGTGTPTYTDIGPFEYQP